MAKKKKPTKKEKISNNRVRMSGASSNKLQAEEAKRLSASNFVVGVGASDLAREKFSSASQVVRRAAGGGEKSKSLSLKTQFSEAKNYLAESKNYIYAIVGLFFISAIFGFIFKENLAFLNDMLKDLIRETENLNTWETIFFILQNNLQSALIACVSGVFLGIVPLTNAILNGLVLGYVAALSTEVAGFGILWRLLPHGIFELPAIFIALGLGIKLGFSIFNPVKFKRNFYNSANTFLMIIIPLLILAAFIEGILIGLLN